MYYLELILSPIVWIMNWALDFYVGLTGSTGLSILLVSFTFALLLLPLRKMAARPGNSASVKKHN